MRSAYLEIKILIMELKKLVLLHQHKLDMKPTTFPCSVIQWYQMHQIFVFYVSYGNLKEKDHIRRNINSKKKEMFISEISIIIMLISQKIRIGWACTTKNYVAFALQKDLFSFCPCKPFSITKMHVSYKFQLP